MFKDTTWIAIDIETDGLEHVGGQILEMSMHHMDKDLNILSSFEGVLPFDPDNFSEFIQDMHTKNGLIACDPTTTHAEVLKWLQQFENIVFLGSSVQFDRTWMLHHFPEAEISHRVIDASSFKGLVDLTGDLPKAGVKHRAYDDIMYSLSILRLYKEKLDA